MKVKIEISICTGLMLNDHSNPYIESTTVLSDIIIHATRGSSFSCGNVTALGVLCSFAFLFVLLCFFLPSFCTSH